VTLRGDLPVRLVSVLGPTGALDLAVVATAPVRDLLPELARALGANVSSGWTLVLVESQLDDGGRPGGVAVPVRLDDDTSLADASVVDGDRLHLTRA
jgi:uncharacterized ubiquitin-like protein YukD